MAVGGGGHGGILYLTLTVEDAGGRDRPFAIPFTRVTTLRVSSDPDVVRFGGRGGDGGGGGGSGGSAFTANASKSSSRIDVPISDARNIQALLARVLSHGGSEIHGVHDTSLAFRTTVLQGRDNDKPFHISAWRMASGYEGPLGLMHDMAALLQAIGGLFPRADVGHDFDVEHL